VSPVLAFGDDRSDEADICWSWIQSQRWDGWRLEIVTAEPHPDMAPVDPEEAKLHPWEPDEPRTPGAGGFVDVEHLRAEIDPRVALISRSWDLVAIGPRGEGILKGLHLGSTADWLLREPTSPLVIARHPGRVGTVLFAADGSAHARRALDTLIKLPWVSDMRVRVVTAEDGHVDATGAQEEARSALARAVAEVEGKVLQGGARRAILEEIENSAPDMVVMGARGIKGVKRLVVGSTTAAVANSTDRTLLIVHAEMESI
jgi:nucleotide-binding universal stress UspA family protein